MAPMKFIISEVFHMNQSDFAKRIGVGQASVSRWCNGVEPDRGHMDMIRQAALDDGLTFMGEPWQDRWFFDPPVVEASGA